MWEEVAAVGLIARSDGCGRGLFTSRMEVHVLKSGRISCIRAIVGCIVERKDTA